MRGEVPKPRHLRLLHIVKDEISIEQSKINQERVNLHTCMHSPQHAGDKFVDTIALLHQRNQRGNSTLVISTRQEVREDQLLECVDLILQGHEIANCLVADGCQRETGRDSKEGILGLPFIRIIDGLQTDIFLILKQT